MQPVQQPDPARERQPLREDDYMYIPIPPSGVVRVPKRPPGKEPEATKDQSNQPENKSKSWLRSLFSHVEGFTPPRPNRLLMRILDPVNRILALGGVPILRRIPLVRSIPFVSGLVKVHRLDFPGADREALRRVVSRDTAAFVGPNHAETFTDWCLDKEVASQVAPGMAHWATRGVVNGFKILQPFWLANNLIANVPGGGGKQHSIEWAAKGNGVLLHPEGHVQWTSDKVQHLFPGIVDMAIDAVRYLDARGDTARPVYVVPIAWRLFFLRDAEKGLHREMKKIEKRLGLPRSRSRSVIDRFAALQLEIQHRQEAEYNLPLELRAEPLSTRNLFARQRVLFDYLRRSLEERYGEVDGAPAQVVYRLRKKIKEHKSEDRERAAKDRKKAGEMDRLLGFTEDVYGRPEFYQEHIAECLKRIQDVFFNRSIIDTTMNLIACPVEPRVARIRIACPIDVRHHLGTGTRDEVRDRILALHKERLQRAITELGLDEEQRPERRVYANPFRSAS